MVMHHGIKLRHLRAFLTVADTGSVTAAADRIGVSQPALSKTLSELQTMLDGTLLERSGRRTTLSPIGERFRRHALQALQHLDAGADAISLPRRTERVSVGVLPTVAGRFFPEAALDYSKLRPNIVIRTETGPHAYLLDRLRAGAIDLMVGRMPASSEMPGLSFDWLYDEDIVLAARADHPLLEISPRDAIARSSLVIPPKGAIIRRAVDEYLLSLGITEPDIRIETVSLAMACQILAASDMLWFISRGVIDRELKRGTLSTFHIDVPYLSGAVGTTRRNEGQQEPNLAELLDVLHKLARNRGQTDGS
ncbi:LysR substrate-binding domain-containing protein [uncultured Jannaschia sp.]|uniref:LysR substrate-binding domain-containing protein n=1 Tax=uncultured Jannaschia sp. TaxID=293347 RepID=UPI0026250138|nr:LysR substrate-binding domain-containing protein [uncultured Jannaschia sp.]